MKVLGYEVLPYRSGIRSFAHQWAYDLAPLGDDSPVFGCLDAMNTSIPSKHGCACFAEDRESRNRKCFQFFGSHQVARNPVMLHGLIESWS